MGSAAHLALLLTRSPRPVSPGGLQVEPDRVGTLNEERAEIGVPSFGDAKQPCLSAGRHLPWDKPQPRREVARAVEGIPICNGRHQGSRNQRTDTWHLHKSAAGCVFSRKGRDLIAETL